VVLDVDLELGGSDQLFNMMMGRQLQRSMNNREKFVLTTPIINGTDGRKMSKSYGNFIALTEPANDMYGKLMSVADAEIVTYLTVLTDMPMAEVSEIENQLKSGANPMEFKKKLALVVTEMYHDAEQAGQAQEHFERTVQNREVPEEIPEITIKSGATILEAMQQSLLEESNSNLRRLLEQGGVSLDETKVTDPNQAITQSAILKVGKRRYFKLKVGE